MRARTGLWEPWGSNPPGPPDSPCLPDLQSEDAWWSSDIEPTVCSPRTEAFNTQTSHRYQARTPRVFSSPTASPAWSPTAHHRPTQENTPLPSQKCLFFRRINATMETMTAESKANLPPQTWGNQSVSPVTTSRKGLPGSRRTGRPSLRALPVTLLNESRSISCTVY